MIELADDLDIDTVTEVFIRVNSAGTELSQADFAMSKIAVNETYGGNLLRKAIDYSCHLAVAPEFLSRIEKNDKAFAASEFLPQIQPQANGELGQLPRALVSMKERPKKKRFSPLGLVS